MFLTNLALIVGVLALFAACGWWVVAPFREEFSYPVAQAPLAGLVVLSLGTLAAFVLLRCPLVHALGLAALACVAASVLCLCFIGPPGSARELGFLAVAALVTAMAAVWFVTPTDLFFRGPGLLYAHGTDHLGYAHIADWMLAHPGVAALAAPDPVDWYGSWPQLIYLHDPRFGSFTLLAVVSRLTGRPPAFAYDIACAVVLTAASLGVAALFARRRVTYLTLGAGLFIGFWFDWSRAGYFAKILGYPATFLVVAYFFAWTRRLQAGAPSVFRALASLIVLVSGAAILFSGLVTATLLVLFGAVFAVALAFENPSSDGSRVPRVVEPLVVLLVLIVVSLTSSGIIARPHFPSSGAWPFSWINTALRSLELESVVGSGVLKRPLDVALGALLVVSWFALAALAWRRRLPESFALLTAPLILAAVLVTTDARWHAFQLSGTFVPAFLGGAAVVCDRGRLSATRRSAMVAALMLAVAVHAPRFVSVTRFSGGAETPARLRFSSAETDRLASVVAREGGAMVDAGGDSQFGIFLLVELGRRHIPLQWTERSWKAILGYRPWPVPRYPAPARVRIVERSDANSGSPSLLLRTTQFDVLREP